MQCFLSKYLSLKLMRKIHKIKIIFNQIDEISDISDEVEFYQKESNEEIERAKNSIKRIFIHDLTTLQADIDYQVNYISDLQIMFTIAALKGKYNDMAVFVNEITQVFENNIIPSIRAYAHAYQSDVRDEYYIRFSKRVRRLKVMEECIRKKNRSTRYRKIDID